MRHIGGLTLVIYTNHIQQITSSRALSVHVSRSHGKILRIQYRQKPEKSASSDTDSPQNMFYPRPLVVISHMASIRGITTAGGDSNQQADGGRGGKRARGGYRGEGRPSGGKLGHQSGDGKRLGAPNMWTKVKEDEGVGRVRGSLHFWCLPSVLWPFVHRSPDTLSFRREHPNPTE